MIAGGAENAEEHHADQGEAERHGTGDELARPQMDGSPAMGPTTGAAGASWATGRPDSPAVASTVVIGFAP